MSNDTELVLLFAMLHLIALAAGGGLLLLAFSAGDGYEDAHPGRGSAATSRPTLQADPSAGHRYPSPRPRASACENPHDLRISDPRRPVAGRGTRSDRHRDRRPRPPTAGPNRGDRRMFRELLVAFDGSSHAQRAFAEARDLAQATAGRLTVMTVVPEPSTWALSSGYGAAVNLEELTAQIEREYETMLDSAVDTIPDDVPVNKILTRGPAGPSIGAEASATSTT